jgi:hypothetical protein
MSNRNTRKKRDNLQNVPGNRQCGAKTRAGTPCKNWGRWPSGRCRMHGGNSYRGGASPSLKHGGYSKYFPYIYLRKRAQLELKIEREVRAELAKRDAERQARDKQAAERAENDRKRLEQMDFSVLQSLMTQGRFSVLDVASHAPTEDPGQSG